MPQPGLTIEPLEDLDALRLLLRRRWGETLMMFARTWRIGDYNALVARDHEGEVAGLTTYSLLKTTMLMLTLDNFSTRPGVGRLLLDHVTALAREQGARSLRVLTTNDNTTALRYFQMRGFKIVAFYPGAIAVYRAVTPTLPEFGQDGIPVRDGIELEIDL